VARSGEFYIFPQLCHNFLCSVSNDLPHYSGTKPSTQDNLAYCELPMRQVSHFPLVYSRRKSICTMYRGQEIAQSPPVTSDKLVCKAAQWMIFRQISLKPSNAFGRVQVKWQRKVGRRGEIFRKCLCRQDFMRALAQDLLVVRRSNEKAATI
jgi:hypothetical protein